MEAVQALKAISLGLLVLASTNFAPLFTLPLVLHFCLQLKISLPYVGVDRGAETEHKFLQLQYLYTECLEVWFWTQRPEVIFFR